MDKSQPPPYYNGPPQPGLHRHKYSAGTTGALIAPRTTTINRKQTTTRPNLVPIGNEPTRVTCPSCHAEILTTVKHTANSRTHCWALVLCLFICWPCVCIPYCMDSCQSANHYCPNCNAYIGTFDN
ncbi:hypothetical protein DOY81_008949 [Sarcophaga bullata]|nr:hypothetical protein DOY81_008949 [Sarcophaga bullata]